MPPWDGVKRLPESFQRGMSLAHNWQDFGARGYGTKTSQATLQELSRLGVRYVSLMPFGFMRSVNADEIRLATGPGAGEGDDRLRQEVGFARQAGIKVMLKPHLWIANGAWVGQIRPERTKTTKANEAQEPADPWDRFFASYRTFVLHYAKLAAELNLEILCIGVELATTTSKTHEKRWRALIEEVKQVYKGKLVYGANWDEVEQVPFWDAVDYIGCQFYAPLGKGSYFSDKALDKKLQGELDRLMALSTRNSKKVLFTEVGYKALPDALKEPHVWPEHLDPHQSADERTQAQGYRVFFKGIQDRPFVEGAYLWKWFTDPQTDEEPAWGFSPRGKQAQKVFCVAYGTTC